MLFFSEESFIIVMQMCCDVLMGLEGLLFGGVGRVQFCEGFYFVGVDVYDVG